MPWIACELHSHTFHSDGKQTLMELAIGAKALGFECIALTDHNTMTGLNDKDAVEQETGISIISGMEWTTFYGHMVTLGLTHFADWRPVGPDDIHKGIADVHRSGGIVGMAHPYRIGSPICTGCFWEFNIEDWNDMDYIEVW
ncbi:CehA/McbA family metallohydrolase [Paenibacillus sp. V4I7]|uniref:CehA/McbA family metallohydrolase n=1 Tax=Paenibacillus sp. V4I7 TaxID=3042307 RepID=UPI002786D97A|nr:CehA/McbA family metallohydrolase [Paenibacillus sp. V4I7]MDQ0897976.1 putative metal-dependent phosphoesterase TrpH [Paenibacillus sp. V4I7]MDQ0916022.1 putative metal-dependent phosphoesterase TrpH [Paenibacillus sp. V4I5]